MGYRARGFESHLRDRFDIHIGYREGNKILALLRFWKFLRRHRPDVTYVFDISYSAVMGSWLHRLFMRNVLIVETGDAIYELMRSNGNRGRLGLWLTRWLENFSLRMANHLVVRGTYHQRWLKQQGLKSDVIQDGVEAEAFAPHRAEYLRRKHGLNGELTVGMVGSSVWSEKLGMCYGWDLVETMRLVAQQPVRGIMIGDGSGIAHLKTLCREYGIQEKVLFLGRIPSETLPQYLSMIDVCLSTQTNDLVGRVRTTGKLPLYLANGRYVLASDVGEASLVLPKEMLVHYEGIKDEEYPARLKEKIETLLARPEILAGAANNIDVAKHNFDYALLAVRMREIIEGAVTQA